MATIKRFRQLLFSINYIVIRKGDDSHKEFFELFREYNAEVFESLVNVFEAKRFSSRYCQLIKAIFNMSTELFNMDIFNQILNANMLSYYGLAEEFSEKVKGSLSKFSSISKRITLVEDRLLQENPRCYNIFETHTIHSKRPKLRDTRIFTEPKLNYGAQMQLSEYYMKIFYLKGGFSNYESYEDLIEDQLMTISDSESEPESDEFFETRNKKIISSKRFTFSKQPSDHQKR